MIENKFYSQGFEDYKLYEKYLNYENGFFIELGAMDGVKFSNTKFFEDNLNWSGILIEPTNQFNDLIKNRPNCFNFNFAVSERNGRIDFIGEGAIGGIKSTMSFIHKLTFGIENLKSYEVDSIPLKDILFLAKQQGAKINLIDFLSIDVEGGELEVLKTFDWNIPVYLIMIELYGTDIERDEKCRNFLKEKNFELTDVFEINEIWINKNNKRY